MSAALCGSRRLRETRLEGFQEQYNLGYNLYLKISKANSIVKEDLEPLLTAVDGKLRKLKSLQTLSELLWLDSKGHGNFMTCNTLHSENLFNQWKLPSRNVDFPIENGDCP